MPKYLMLIVESESGVRESASEADFNDVMQQHAAFTAEVEEAGGKILGGEALQPTLDGDLPPRHPRRRHRRRQPGARPQGDPRRLLPRRGRRRRARPPDRRAAARRRTATSRCDRSGRSPRSMPDDAGGAAAADAQRLYWGRVLAATLRMARDVDIAEEATADAFALALQTWPDRGVPDSVEAWLLTAARRRAIDRIRRLARFRERLAAIAATGDLTAQPADAGLDAPPVLDDELRLVVLCCHPALAQEVQVALTMRLGCGVPTASVAAAFLVPEATMAARLTRAKKRIAESGAGIEPARRRRRRGAHAGGAPDDPPRLHDGPHRRIGSDAAPRRRRRPRRTSGPDAARLAPRRQRGDRPAGADPAHRGPRRHASRRRRRPGAARRRRPHAVGRSADRRRARRLVAAAATTPGRSACRRRSPPSTPARASFEATDWRRIVGCYDALLTTRAEPDDRHRALRGVVLRRRSGGRARRPRRGARPRRARRLPLRPRRPGTDPRPPRPRRRGGRVVGRRRTQCARTDAERAFFAARQA